MSPAHLLYIILVLHRARQAGQGGACTWEVDEGDAAAASAEEGQVRGAHAQAAAEQAADDRGVGDHGYRAPPVLVRGRLQGLPGAPAALPERIHRLSCAPRVRCHLRWCIFCLYSPAVILAVEIYTGTARSACCEVR